MAAELFAGTSQLRLVSLYAQRSKQLRAGIARQLFQIQAQSRGALVICQIRHWQARGNYAQSRIKGSEFAQQRLEGRLTYPSFLGARWILQRLQAVENQEGSTMGNEFR